MTLEILVLLLILIGASVLYTTRWLPIEITSTLIIASLALSGVLEVPQAMAGFSSTATLTVAAMFVLSGGLLRTGALEIVTIQLSRFSDGSPRRLLLLLALIIPPASAIMNNTPVVVMMVPVILSLSDQFEIQPSKLLIPVSYFAVLGGTMTLLGTSTNILIDDLYRSAGGPGFDLFTFTPLGVLITLIGSIFIILISQRILPERAPLAGLAGSRHKSSVFITELIVDSESLLTGKEVREVFQDNSLFAAPPRPRLGRHHRRVRPISRQGMAGRSDDRENASGAIQLLQLFRGERIYRGKEGSRLTLEPGDALLVSGSPTNITRFMEETGTRLASVVEDEVRRPVTSVEQTVVEAVVLPDSPTNNRLISNLGLAQNHDVKIMGLQRRGGHRRTGLRRIRLQSGDVLLLQGDSEDLHRASQEHRLLLVEGVESSILRQAKNRVALLIMAAVVLAATLTGIPIVVLALTGAALMVVTRCLRVDEALGSLDAATLMLLVGTIPLGTAMETTGMAQMAVDRLLIFAGYSHPIVFLSAFYLFTNLLTQLISNNAVAVLLTPIALSLAASLNVSSQPLLMAIAFGASASFMTPMGYQTNAIVMGPGGYTFADYLRVGIPLTIIVWITATIFIPIFWPL